MRNQQDMRKLSMSLAACASLASSFAAATPQVPLCKGLQVVTAVSEIKGDYESIKTIESVGAAEVRMKYSAEMPDPGLFADEGATVKVTEDRRLRTADLRAATHYVPVFAQESDGFFPGTTAIGTSTAILQALNTKGEASAVFTFDTTEDGAIRASRNMDSNVYDSSIKAQLKRMGAVKVPVLVNDRRVTLNAIRVRATLDGESQPSEFVFLDDEANPLTLSFRIARTSNAAPGIPGMAETCADMRKLGMPVDEEMCAAAVSGAGSGATWLGTGQKAGTLTVVKINYQCASPETAGSGPSLEESLQETGRADIYSIYFSFNSDVIREESEPTLEEIAGLMRKHPDWKLSVHGHTDNIASDRYNLDLSQRRAAAVMGALTSRYGVAGNRLAYAGHGESSPIDRNDTLEGRARNRRVELVRMP